MKYKKEVEREMNRFRKYLTAIIIILLK